MGKLGKKQENSIKRNGQRPFLSYICFSALRAFCLAGDGQLAFSAAVPGRKALPHLVLKAGADTVILLFLADGVDNAAFPAGTAECAIFIGICIGPGRYGQG